MYVDYEQCMRIVASGFLSPWVINLSARECWYARELHTDNLIRIQYEHTEHVGWDVEIN